MDQNKGFTVIWENGYVVLSFLIHDFTVISWFHENVLFFTSPNQKIYLVDPDQNRVIWVLTYLVSFLKCWKTSLVALFWWFVHLGHFFSTKTVQSLFTFLWSPLLGFGQDNLGQLWNLAGFKDKIHSFWISFFCALT